jgi:hypothetical protein
MTNPRMRSVAIGGSMALALSIVATPALAQDDPTATIQGFMDAIVAKDFEALPSYFCEAEADQAAQFDLAAIAGEMPEGLDVQSLLDAFIFDIQLESMEVISQDETEAVVAVTGTMAMDIDPEPLVPFVEAIIEMSGMEADEATVEMFMGMMTAEFEAQSESIDTEVTLVPGETRPWLICSDLDFSGDSVTDDGTTEGASPDATDDMSPDATDSVSAEGATTEEEDSE